MNCYSAILNVDQEIAEIDTGVDNGRVLVVFKDSFGNALIPFFTHGFSKIYVCDFRYFDINAIDFVKRWLHRPVVCNIVDELFNA